MVDINNELMFEILKSIQSKLDQNDKVYSELLRGQLRLREDLHNFHGDSLRLESQVVELSMRIDRIQKRLELSDA